MAGIVALGVGALTAGASAITTADANATAAKTQAEEAQLLNEAHQQQDQQQEQTQLIGQRNAQEASLNGASPKFDASKTILTGPLGIPAAANSKAGNQPQLLGT